MRDCVSAPPARGRIGSAREVRILFLTTLLPGARGSGSELASQAFVDGLRALGHDVTVLAYRRAGDTPPVHPGDVAVADRHIETSGAGARPLLWMARALATPAAVLGGQVRVARATAARSATRLAGEPPALVVLDHAAMGWLVPRGGWPVPWAYLAHNVEHRLYEGLAASGGPRRWVNSREAALIRRCEERLCGAAGAVWALTADDADALAALGAGERATSFDLPVAGRRRGRRRRRAHV